MKDYYFTSGNLFLSKSEEETEIDIALWNSQIKPDDFVYCLGDFSVNPYFINADNLKNIFNKLNGNKSLIFSRNDTADCKLNLDWNVRESMMEFELFYSTSKTYHFVLSHYPFEYWNKKENNSIHLFGLYNNNLSKISNRLSVHQKYHFGLPIKFENIITKLNTKFYGENL